ncbi:MAG: hypothetical protein V1717_00010 [Candidatus Micrarchaeota archaeon]
MQGRFEPRSVAKELLEHEKKLNGMDLIAIEKWREHERFKRNYGEYLDDVERNHSGSSAYPDLGPVTGRPEHMDEQTLLKFLAQKWSSVKKAGDQYRQ